MKMANSPAFCSVISFSFMSYSLVYHYLPHARLNLESSASTYFITELELQFSLWDQAESELQGLHIYIQIQTSINSRGDG